MKIKRQRDFWAGTMFLVVGIAFAWGATSYSFGASARPGPGYFPFGLGLLLALLGVIEIFKAFTALLPDAEGEHLIGKVAWKPLALITGSVVVFGLALPHLGLLIALPLLVTISAMAGDDFKWKEAILSSVVLTAGSWVIFAWGLKLVIPMVPEFFG
ncbi:MAG TPA: tripartite tricarboxylate transporter TctB family protein [Ideonella sp.]|nr:tripartite tricarboxylate transporter TctB family protein [Ideonella sp.]